MQAEDTQFSMDKERRKESLKNFLLYIHQHIEKERKGREGESNSDGYTHVKAVSSTDNVLIHFLLIWGGGGGGYYSLFVMLVR